MDIIVFDQQGKKHEIEGSDAVSVMEMIRNFGLPIAAQCGGSTACATCHVYVAPEWQDRLQPKSEEEADMLEIAVEVKPESRLSCQLGIDPNLNGLIVSLAPGTEF